MSISTNRIFHTEALPATILSFLDLRDQTIVAQVSKIWNQAASKQFLGAYLSYGQRHALRSLVFNEPQITSLTLAPTDSLMSVVDKTVLIFQDHNPDIPFTPNVAFVRDLNSGIKHNISLAKFLPNLMVRPRILATALLPSSRMVTFSDDITIRVYDYAKDTLLVTQTLAHPLAGRKILLGETVGVAGHRRWEAFHIHSQTLTQRVSDPSSYLLHTSSSYLFFGQQWEGFEREYATLSAFDPQRANFLWTHRYSFDPDSGSHGAQGIVGVNHQEVVAADLIYDGFNRYRMSFAILDIKTGNRLEGFEEDYSHLANKIPALQERERAETVLKCEKFSWLSGEFLAIWLGKEINVWHIPTKELLTAINLEALCPPEELDATHPNFFPVCSFEVENKEIRLVLNSLNNKELRLVKFPIKVSSEPNAIRKIPERSMTPCTTRAFNRVKRAAIQLWNKIFHREKIE